MKRYNNLYPQITDFSNLILAARQAQRGKRFRENVLKFNYNLEAELIKIKTELESRTYQPGRYKTFEICEPKPRLISAAPVMSVTISEYKAGLGSLVGVNRTVAQLY